MKIFKQLNNPKLLSKKNSKLQLDRKPNFLIETQDLLILSQELMIFLEILLKVDDNNISIIQICKNTNKRFKNN